MTIDTNCHLGHWPFRRHGFEDTSKFVDKLGAVGVREAWVSSFEGVLHKDMAGVNARLSADCRERGPKTLIPIGVVNPRLPDWKDDLRRCGEVHQMPGIRLYPNYHGYRLDDPDLATLLGLAAKNGLIVQIVVKLEDERTHHPLMKVPSVDLGPLPKIVSTVRGLTLQILNCPVPATGEALVPLARAGQVSFDFAMQEGVGAVARLVDRVGVDRVVYGSHFPLFLAESSALKLKEADLPAEVEQAVRSGNARKLIPGPK